MMFNNGAIIMIDIILRMVIIYLVICCVIVFGMDCIIGGRILMDGC